MSATIEWTEQYDGLRPDGAKRRRRWATLLGGKPVYILEGVLGAHSLHVEADDLSTWTINLDTEDIEVAKRKVLELMRPVYEHNIEVLRASLDAINATLRSDLETA